MEAIVPERHILILDNNTHIKLSLSINQPGRVFMKSVENMPYFVVRIVRDAWKSPEVYTDRGHVPVHSTQEVPLPRPLSS